MANITVTVTPPDEINVTAINSNEYTVSITESSPVSVSVSPQSGLQGLQGDDAPEVQFQYSIDGITLWHTVPVADDYYFRSSTDGGVTWGIAILFHGTNSEGGGTPSSTVVSETSYGQSATAGTAITYSRGNHSHGTPVLPSKSDVDLGNVDNTSDIDKPISMATQSALTVITTALSSTDKNIDRLDSSSLISGGILTISADTQHFDLSAGTGVIIDAYTDPLNPVRTVVTWIDKLNVAPLYILDGATSYIGIDINGDVIQWDSNYYTDAERRQYIIIGWVNHVDNTYIDFVYQEPIYSADIMNQLTDFFDNFGPFNITGNEYSYFTGLALHRTYGKVFDVASNYQNAKNNPNIIESLAQDSTAIYYSYRDGVGSWYNEPNPTTDINPNQYDTGTGLASVDAGKFTIQIITYYAIWDSTDIQYGQVIYDTLLEARAAINDVVELNPYNSGYDVFRAWLVVKSGCTDLSVAEDALFISAGRLGLFASAAGGGNTGSLTDAENVGAGGEGWYDGKVGPTLNFRNAYAVSPIIVSNVTASKRLEFSIPLANSTQAGYIGTEAFQIFSSKAENTHTHGNLALTNLNGTSASNGLSLSVAAGGGDGYNIIAVGGSTAAQSATIVFSNSNNISFGLNGSTLTANYDSSLLMATGERNNYYYTSNNTFANSTHSHGNLALTNINGTSASSGLSLSVTGQSQQPMYFSASGTSTSGNTIQFGNSNGVSFSLSNGSLVGTVATNYMASNLTSNFQYTSNTSGITSNAMNTSERNNYFYTSNNTFANNTHSHGNPTLALTNITGTTASASSGVTFSLSGNAAQTQQPMYFSASGTNTSANTLQFGNSNGISFSLSNGSLVGTIATTYLGTNQTSNFQYTSNTSNITSNAMATGERNNYYYTSNNTFANSTHSHGNPTLALTNLNGTTASNSNGLTLSLSVAAGGGDGYNIIAAGGSTAAQSASIVFSNSNNISFSLNGSTVTASFNSTLLMATGERNNYYYTSNNTFANSTHIHGNPTLALTNISGTTATASNGVTFSLSVAAPGAGGGIAIQDSVGTITNNTVYFSNINGISFGLNGSTMTASYSSNHSHGNPTLALTNLSGTTNSASNGVTFSLSAAAPGGGAAATLSYYEPYPINNTGTGIISAHTGTSGSVTLIPFYFENNVEFDFINMLISMNFTTGGTSAFTQVRTVQWGIYSLSNNSTLNRIGSSSLGMSVTYNNSNITFSHPMTTGSNAFTYQTTSSAGLGISSAYTGLKAFQLPFATSLSQGKYWLGLYNRATTTGFNSGILMSVYGNSNTLTVVAPMGKYSSAYSTGTNLEGGLFGFMDGPYVFTSAGQTDLPSSARISAMSENVPVIPYMRFWQT